jgi:hypothetical protein
LLIGNSSIFVSKQHYHKTVFNLTFWFVDYVIELAFKKSDECLAYCWDIARLRRVECARVWGQDVQHRGDLASKSSTWLPTIGNTRLIMLELNLIKI